MALPAQVLTQTATGDLKVLRWLEIEGSPYAYGNRFIPNSFWSTGPTFVCAVAGMTDKVPRGVDIGFDLLEGLAYRPGEMEFPLLDVGDYSGWLTAAMEIGRYEASGAMTVLSSAITESTTSFAVANASGWPSTGYGYIGKETFYWSSNTAGTLGGITRGLFRSTGIAHSAGQEVTQYPTVLGRRRVWYFICFADPVTGTWAITNRMTRFGGTIIDYSSEGGVIRLKVRSGDGDLGLGNASMSPRLFRSLRHGKTLDTMGGWQ